MTTTQLPLFPLNTVLYPGLVLPLNVFEDRYRALMADLAAVPDEDDRAFGVIAIREGHEVAPTALGLPDGEPLPAGPGAGFADDPMASFHEVGCVADASTIRERPDGSGYEVVATGTTRFRLRSVTAGEQYLTGEVELLEEEEGEGAAPLAQGVLRAFRAYQRELATAMERTLAGEQELPDEPSVVSYLVAAATLLSTAEKQELLQAPDTAERLARELKLLRRETTLIGKLPSVPGADFTQRPTYLN
ncbi:LON peptidase substrate-binding domain-containing protein [Streptomyces bohaiensis]|uniref:LON peptidase substrate-binding domain-containing protein n=1 Tax=Streptomyces bohaiensis TaxID=1431344 RepID=A0ABX1C6P9_9ACTN|nr:LON peptidase substrate-binding domain-containing protein [Streptomyces bohaiensis]NJQ14849.1 LON peptidase substrate-binding domain-containing protein [Streptomyces bohaiensis]